MRTRVTKAVHPAPPPDRSLAIAAALAVALLAVYLNALGNPFVIDDQNAIVDNPSIRELLPLSVTLSPPRDTPVAGRPLVNLTFALNYAIGGLDVRGYRLFNLAIHLLAALALFGIVRRTWERLGDGGGGASAVPVAFACAAIWLLHPLQTEVVNYVTQRTTALKGLFYLVTLYCSIRALERPRGRWAPLAVLSCAAGMACKESMVTAPVMVALYDRAFAFASMRDALRARGALYAGLAGTWLVLAALLAGVPRTTVGFETGVDPWTYFLNQVTIVTDYLRLVVLPRELVVDYGVPRTLAPAEVLGPAAFLVALGVASVIALIRRPPLGFLGAWFFITLAPTSSFVPIATEVGAERRMYLPLAAIVALAVWAAVRAASAWRLPRRAVAAAAVIICVGLSVGTVLRNREYGSELELARTVVERRPHGRAYLHLATVLIQEGRRQEAFPYIERARSAGAVGARFVLGTEYLIEGKTDAGIRELEAFVRRHPAHFNVVPAREMLGRAYLERGRIDEAADQFAEVVRIVPNHAVAHDALGDLRLWQGRADDALPHLIFTAGQRAGDVAALGKLGTALAAGGRLNEAIDVLLRAVAADPNHAQARTVLGRALAEQGRLEEALVHLERAAELDPGNELARRDVGAARAQLAARR